MADRFQTGGEGFFNALGASTTLGCASMEDGRSINGGYIDARRMTAIWQLDGMTRQDRWRTDGIWMTDRQQIGGR